MKNQNKLLNILEIKFQKLLKNGFNTSDKNKNVAQIIYLTGALDIFNTLNELDDEIFNYSPSTIKSLLSFKLLELSNELIEQYPKGMKMDGGELPI